MNFPWKNVLHPEDIDDILRASAIRPQVIFKHSTRCNISSVAKRRLENAGPVENVDFHYLDVISCRDLSNKVGQLFQVHHESPQVLVAVNGECIYDESHLAIDMDEIVEIASGKK